MTLQNLIKQVCP